MDGTDSRVRRVAGLVLLLLAPVARAEDAETLLAELRAPAMVLAEDAVAVRNVEADLGLATLHLDEGVLFPATPVAGRPVEMVFLGAGRLVADPPDQIERQQLELFTGEVVLNASFQSAVFTVPGDHAVDALLGARARVAVPGGTLEEARELLTYWKTSAERNVLAPDGALLLDALGDPAMEAYFAGWFRDELRGDFLYFVEPDEFEQVTLGQFVAEEISRREKRKLRSALHNEQRRGRLIGLELDDLGTWDTWISAPLQDGAGQPTPASAPFEPVHYDIEAHLLRNQKMTVTAAVRLRAVQGDRRGLRMKLFPDLEVSRVTNGQGQPLAFVQERGDLTIALASPPAADEERIIRIDYGGAIFGRSSARAFALRSTAEWYPRAGSLDRATYDVRLRYPAKFDVVGSGARVEHEREGDEVSERRLLEVPAANFSFEMGVFDVEEVQVGDIAVLFGFDRQSRTLDESIRRQMLDTVREVLEFYTQLYGPYPLDHLTVVTVPRDFSQGFLGFVTLSDQAMSEWGALGWLLGTEDRRTIIAHEIAHQWWGNVVGWRSYRDQWLSEAMADHAALLFARQWENGKAKVERGPLTGAKSRLLRRTENGRSIESLGPVVLGIRLNSSLSDDAYQPIVYQKGAMVLDTLGRLFQPEVYREMLRRIVQTGGSKVISTEEFLEALAHMSGVNLDAFADRFIFGTGLPQIDYSFEFARDPSGGWEVRGTSIQRSLYRLQYRLVKTRTGHDIAGERIVEGPDTMPMVVPFQILAHPAPDAPNQDERLVLFGRVGLTGPTSSFSVNTDYEPIDFWLDKDGEALARFACENRYPKATLAGRGVDLAAAGSWAEAEAAFRQALDSPISVKPPDSRNEDEPDEEEVTGDAEDPPSKRRLRADAMLNLRLAELYLDQGRDDDAAASVAAAEALIRQSRGSLSGALFDRVRNRMDLRRGDYAPVYRRLRSVLFPRSPRPATEDLLMLAVAARERGHASEAEKSLSLARDRGADVSNLE